MKICPITVFNYNKQKVSRPNHGHSTPLSGLACDTVSFSSKQKVKKQHFVKDLRLIPDITCACCGKKTVVSKDIDNFIEDKLIFSSSEAIKILEKAKLVQTTGTLADSEQRAYLFCKMFSIMYPDKSFTSIFKQKSARDIMNGLDADTKRDIIGIEKLSRKLYHNSSYMVDELKPFEPYMHKSEREVFSVLEAESIKTPYKTFSEILNTRRIQNTHLQVLVMKQNKVFKDIEELSSPMSPKSRKIVKRAIRQSKAIFNAPSSQVGSKRTMVIEFFKEVCSSLPERKTADNILAKIYELPSSLNDSSSFIVKHADKNPVQIADLLIRPSAATIEHVKPRHRENDNGKDEISNFIVLCKKCNEERGRMPYPEFEKIHRDMPQNTQKYVDKVIDCINDGVLLGYDSYPLEIFKALENERKTNKPINISRLNLIEAVKNRGGK